MSFNQPFWSRLNLIFQSQVISFGKQRCFCWLSNMTYNVQICNFLWVHFLIFGRWRCTVWNYILLKMRFWWVIYHKLWESYAWSKFSWLFLQNPNLATLSLDEFWAILDESWSTLDQMIISFKMRMLAKNLEVWLLVGHSWLLPYHNRFLDLWANDWANFLCKAWNLTWMILRTY